jgi:hypothetical protein
MVKTECTKIWKFCCSVIWGLNLFLQAALNKQEISRKAAADTGEESEGSNDDASHSDDDDDQHSQGDKVKLWEFLVCHKWNCFWKETTQEK